MPVQFNQLGRAEAIIQSRPDPSVLNTRPDSAEAESARAARADQATRTETTRPVQQAAAEARISFEGGDRVDRRDAGQALRSAATRTGVAQQARAVIRNGRDDLELLDNLARDANERQIDQADADRIRERLREADRDPSLQQARREVETGRLADEADAAEDDARQVAREVLERPSLPEQSTLALVPQGVGSESQRDAEAEEAEAEARLARGRAERSEVRQSVLGTRERSVLEPRQADIGGPDEAGETRDAVAEADARSARLEEQLARFEENAADEARALTQDFATRRGGARITTSRDAEATAREVARSTLDDPATALSTQPFLSVEAALRVLA